MTGPFLAGIESWAKGAAPFNGPVAGPFWQQSPPTQPFPYCRYFNVGPAIPEYFTNPNQAIDNVRLQFSFWGSNTSPNYLLYQYANQFIARFKAATIPLSSGIVLACLPSATAYSVPVDPRMKDKDGNPVYHVAVDLRFKAS